VTISPELAAASTRTTIAELTIASGAADHRPMREMIKVAAGPDDRIAILDRAMHNVKIYDSAGVLTRLIDLSNCASELKVPRPFALAFASDGGIWVADIANGRATLLSGDSTCVRTVSIPPGPGLPLGFAVSPSGDLHDAVASIVKVSGSPAIAADITIRSLRVDRPLVASVLAFDNRPQPFALYGPVPLWSWRGDGEMAAASGRAFEIRYFNRSGRPTRVVTSPLTPLPLTAADREVLFAAATADWPETARPAALATLREMSVAEHYPALVALLAADNGDVWAQLPVTAADIRAGRVKTFDFNHTGSPVWLVFSPEGALRMRVELPAGFLLQGVRHDRLYGVVVDDRGGQAVVRRRIAAAN
jgi:hypothetical protein